MRSKITSAIIFLIVLICSVPLIVNAINDRVAQENLLKIDEKNCSIVLPGPVSEIKEIGTRGLIVVGSSKPSMIDVSDNYWKSDGFKLLNSNSIVPVARIKCLEVFDNTIHVFSGRNTLAEYDTETGKLLHTGEIPVEADLLSVEISEDAIYAHDGNRLWTCNRATSETRLLFTSHMPIADVHLLEDSVILHENSQGDNVLRRLSLSDTEVPTKHYTISNELVYGIELHENFAYVLGVNFLHLVDTAQMKLLNKIKMPQSLEHSSIAPDGAFLANAGGNTVQIIDLKSRRVYSKKLEQDHPIRDAVTSIHVHSIDNRVMVAVGNGRLCSYSYDDFLR